MEINQERIEKAIIAEVADKMIGNEELYERAKRAIDVRIDKIFQESATAQIKAAIDQAIRDGFEREYQKVNSFGQATSPKTTISAELEKLIGGYWNQKVDRNGQPSTYSDGVTRAEWMMTQLVASDFKGEMKQHVVNLGGALKDSLRAELHATVNRLLSEIFKVNSLDDQGKKRTDNYGAPVQTGAV